MRRITIVVGLALLASLSLMTLQSVLAQPLGDASGMPLKPGEFLPAMINELFERFDANKDHRLNVDEIPEPFRATFSLIDLDHDGYASRVELNGAVALGTRLASNRGEVVADRLVMTVDDFVVDIYHNGERVPDAKRSLVEEVHGATVERVDIEVRKGDWLVFNAVNNRLRWGGARYFAVAGLKQGSGTGFTTDLTTGRWTACDDPAQVARFVASPDNFGNSPARPIETPWEAGDSLMKSHADGWAGTPVWGESRNTWIKFVAR
jgi:hypothetical protein